MHSMLIHWMKKSIPHYWVAIRIFGGQRLFVLSKRSAESGSVVNISVLIFLPRSAFFILAVGGLGVKK